MTEHVLELSNLACRRGGRLLFSGMDLSLTEGDAALVTGPNGSGKSSLLRVIAGLIQPLQGQIRWEGQNAQKFTVNFRSALRYVGHSDGLQPVLSVLENLKYWSQIYGSSQDLEKLNRGLESVGLFDLSELPARVLSAGQRRRLALAKAIATDGRLWLLDEPTVALDRQSINRIETAISEFRASGGIVIASTNAPLNLSDCKTLNISDYYWAEEN
ncbi:MAG: heme ABC exporter ATP-binding protein CcmA [Rhodospirillales bacterium]